MPEDTLFETGDGKEFKISFFAFSDFCFDCFAIWIKSKAFD